MIDSAADLLCQLHRDVDQGPDQHVLADPQVARALLQDWLGSGPAVAALCHGDFVGFMGASLPPTHGGAAARIRIFQHAAREPGRRDVYRQLYRAISEQLAALGCFTHTISVAANDQTVLRTWFELGFGVDQIRGRRELDPLPKITGRTTIRPAIASDSDALIDLSVEVNQYHAEPPMLRPALVDLPAMRASYRSGIDSEPPSVLVFEDEGSVRGVMQLNPDADYPGTARIGMAGVDRVNRRRGAGTALLHDALQWCRTTGYRKCSAEWTSANLVSDSFWRGHSFEPVLLKLTRVIDARVAWAGPDLDYRYFTPGE
jgi:GNAT superfamily N-acetyltransferase